MARELQFPACDPSVHAEAATPNPGPPFNFDALLEEWSDEPEFLARMLGVFVRDTQVDIDNLTVALGANDTASVARAAHRLKGAAGILGAEPIREQAARLEAMGRKGELAEGTACLTKLRVEFERFRSYLPELPLPPIGC